MAKFKLEDGTEVEAFTTDELKQAIENEIAGLKAKNGELLGLHTKDKERLAELEAAQAKAEEERQKEKGEFKSLYEKTQAELEAERQAAREFKTQVQSKTLEGEAFKLATSLTSDTKRAELLKKEVLQYAKYTDTGVQFEIGGVAVESGKLAEKLRADYPFLADGSGASGGDAKGGAPNVKDISKLTSTQRIAEGLRELTT
jgi:hypothetical protein